MIDTLIAAIQNREEISFTYSGIDRVAQPCAVGTSRTGNDSLRCYQTQGGHVTPGHEWDFCTVSDISNLTTTGVHFQDNPPGYKTGDKGMLTIYAQL